ncbi:hypothetical protein PNOK_0780600 [Pyrrhoderma noxium]|uniref:Uncharacterized protein n=1 Tax=Pyrrhoderma noxium TaxID=2282107 RepID=A0A286U9E7_9AGAM|nr:hypothetical protein PNOK_0780600 [Pyrrhoderma noxium]
MLPIPGVSCSALLQGTSYPINYPVLGSVLSGKVSDVFCDHNFHILPLLLSILNSRLILLTRDLILMG